MVRSRMVRDHFSSRGGYWSQERGVMESNLEPQDIRRPPMSIDQALRDYCNIPAKFYFITTLGHDGKSSYFTAPYLPPSVDVREFFDVEKFERCMERALSGNPPVSQPYDEPSFGMNSKANQYSMEVSRRWTANRPYGEPMPIDAFDEEDLQKTRKRPRVNQLRRRSERSDLPMISATAPKKGITIGDDKTVWQFYHDLLKECQQNACKLIAKAWIKAVEPKKQSTHPYTGKDEKAPDWWPKPWGTTKDEKVRHKEPDHLLRHERLYLLVHILRLIVEPIDNQHSAIQKVNLDVSKLSDITMDALSTWFADKENPANAAKQPLLKELFKLAKAEERYKAGEIDSTSMVYVTSIERMSQGGASDVEELGSTKDDEEQQRHTPISSNPSPQRVGPTHGAVPHQPNMDAGHTNHMQGVEYAPDLLRGTTQMPHMLGSDMAPERPYDVPEIMNMSNMYPGQPDGSRKSSNFASPSDYTSPTSPMYQNWQSSTPPNNQPVYSFTQHAPGPSSNFVGQPGVHMAHHPPFLGSSFDGLPRAHDSQGSNMFRPGAIGQHSLAHQPSYYDTPSIPADVKVEPAIRQPPH